MKHVTFSVTAAFVAATAAWGYLHLEDFESFNDSDDIATSPDWTNWTPTNEICCVDLTGNKVAAIYPADIEECFYIWEASDSAQDYGVFTDFMALDTTPSIESVGVCGRMSGEYPTDFETYFAICVPYADTDYWTMLSLWYENEDGRILLAVEWNTYTFIDVYEWHELGFEVYGEGPVYFRVYLDGVSLITHTEYDYVIDSGHAGLRFNAITEEELICVDNVTQEEIDDTSITPASLGKVKATFR